VVKIDLNQPMDEIRATLSQYPVKTRLSLTGTVVVARDIAHAKFSERLDRGEGLPQYIKDHPVYYAGPAKTPEGTPTGFGPTTAGRMDSYVDMLQAAGGSHGDAGQGQPVEGGARACHKYGGFYLGSVGGPAAAGQGLHPQGRGAGISGTRHGSGLEDRGREFSGLYRHRRQGQ
jgi:fumarate hydratase class I